MNHIESGTVQYYLDSKGLDKDCLNAFSVLLMEKGRFVNYTDFPWAKKEYSLLK